MIPNYQSLMRPVLECAAQGEVQFSEVVAQLADTFKVTDEELNEMLGEQPLFATHVEWAQFLLEQFGLVKPTTRGHFAITDLGKAALADQSALINKHHLERWRDSMRPQGVEGEIERLVEFIAEWEEHLQGLFNSDGIDVVERAYLSEVMRLIRAASIKSAPDGHDGETIYDEKHDLVPTFFSGIPDFVGLHRHMLQKGSEKRVSFGKAPGKFVNVHYIYDDNKGEKLIGIARNNDLAAKSALSYIAGAYVKSGCAMPERLRDYVVEKLRTEVASGPKRRGSKPYTKEARNSLISLTVSTVVRDLGISPTRNRASKDTSKKESACSLVKKALERRGVHLSEAAVEKIWQECRQRTANPQGSRSS